MKIERKLISKTGEIRMHKVVEDDFRIYYTVGTDRESHRFDHQDAALRRFNELARNQQATK
jgi:hypothetical protein